MRFPTPANERTRLKVLWQYGVLDTVPEAMFDDLTELAGAVCGAPIALISLVDEKRQWFKSRLGLNVQETDRDISFCAHAICQHGLFIVPDAARDDRFKNNPLVKGRQGIRFYAGAPLVTPDGYALGTLCVLDKVARDLTPDQRRALQLLARVVMTQLELRRQSLDRGVDSSKDRDWSTVEIQQRPAPPGKRRRTTSSPAAARPSRRRRG